MITILTPTYNRAYRLPALYESLMKQHGSFEWLIVDDGSPDQSIAIAKKMVGEDPYFIFLEKENGGQASARNIV
ncbi:glycosyltransferase family 2 protein [Wohlfahrtiimonas chitiniclastica]|nr:glycosyltransferase family A protein [Wohlfahrtiimonas chitiniclastica]